MTRYRPPRPKGSCYITPEGEKALREELRQLWKVERPQVTATVHEAAKNGDRSENGDYIYGSHAGQATGRRSHCDNPKGLAKLLYYRYSLR